MNTHPTKEEILILFDRMTCGQLPYDFAVLSQALDTYATAKVEEERERLAGEIEAKIEKHNVRDRSYIGAGQSRVSMTGVHEEPKKNKYNEAITDILSLLHPHQDKPSN